MNEEIAGVRQRTRPRPPGGGQMEMAHSAAWLGRKDYSGRGKNGVSRQKENEVRESPQRAFFTAPRDSRHSTTTFSTEAATGQKGREMRTTQRVSFMAESGSQDRERGQAKMGGRNSGGSCRDGAKARGSTVSVGQHGATTVSGRTSRKNSILF